MFAGMGTARALDIADIDRDRAITDLADAYALNHKDRPPDTWCVQCGAHCWTPVGLAAHRRAQHSGLSPRQITIETTGATAA